MQMIQVATMLLPSCRLAVSTTLTLPLPPALDVCHPGNPKSPLDPTPTVLTLALSIPSQHRHLSVPIIDTWQKHKETSSELQRSGERNVKMREERDVLLERIIERESLPPDKPNGASSASPVPIPSSGAFLDLSSRPVPVTPCRTGRSERSGTSLCPCPPLQVF